MKRIDWVVGCAVIAWGLSAMPLDAAGQFGGGGDAASAGNLFGEPAAGPNDFCRCVGEASGKTVDKIIHALDGPVISAGMEFDGTALSEVVAMLQNDYQIPIQLDAPALDSAGIGPDEPVTINVRNISLRSALRLLLKQLQLTYIIQEEVLIITTPEEAEAQLVVCVYDVRDLIGKTQANRPPRGGAGSANFDPMVDMIVSCVSTETWSENGGGEAEIRSLQPGLLVISQTQAVHEEIRSLLKAIRATLDDEAHEPAPGETMRAPDANAAVTRHYRMHFGEGEAVDANQQRIVELLTRLTPNAAWESPLADGQAPILTALPDRLVVRHKESVQDDVEAALQDLGLVSPWQGAAAGQGSGGGFGGVGGGGGGMFRWPPESE